MPPAVWFSNHCQCLEFHLLIFIFRMEMVVSNFCFNLLLKWGPYSKRKTKAEPMTWYWKGLDARPAKVGVQTDFIKKAAPGSQVEDKSNLLFSQWAFGCSELKYQEPEFYLNRKGLYLVCPIFSIMRFYHHCSNTNGSPSQCRKWWTYLPFK